MRCCTVTACLLLSSTIALADEPTTVLAPTCAEIDVARDQLPPETRVLALQLFVRALERAELLVVQQGCTEHFTAWHERTGETYIVRVRGPRGVRKSRNKTVEDFSYVYDRAIELLTEPEESTESQAPADPSPSPDTASAADETEAGQGDASSDEVAAIEPSTSPTSDPSDDVEPPDSAEGVAPDRLLYAQLSLGTHALGFGLGYRRQSGQALFDFSLVHAGSNSSSHTAFGAEVLWLRAPRARSTAYWGGGLSLATQQEGMLSGSGLRAEITGGIAFARDNNVRWFMQADLALPFYTVADPSYPGMERHAPTIGVAIGAGF